MYRHTVTVEYEVYDYAGNNWSHRNGKKKFQESFKAVPGKHSIDSLQKTAVLGTSYIIQKALQSET